MDGEILVGQLCTEQRFTQISKGNWERGNWPTTCAIKSGRWLSKSLSDNCEMSTGTRKHQKATGNEEAGQPPVQSNQAGTQKYLKATGYGEIGQPPVQSNWASGLGNHCRMPVYEAEVAREMLVGQLCT
ncbi:unnamed protein product [Prunus armeniaca]